MKHEDVTPLPCLVMAARSKMPLTQRTWLELVACGYWMMATLTWPAFAGGATTGT